MCTLLLVKGWWQQTVQKLHVSITMQPMALCMLWTEWSVLSLKLLPSFSHRISSSLYSYLVSYLTSAIFSSRYSQHCPVTKYIVISKTLFIVPTDAHYYKVIEMLKQFLKNYNTCSDMFRFAQEPSSGSSPVLS